MQPLAIRDPSSLCPIFGFAKTTAAQSLGENTQPLHLLVAHGSASALRAPIGTCRVPGDKIPIAIQNVNKHGIPPYFEAAESIFALGVPPFSGLGIFWGANQTPINKLGTPSLLAMYA